VVQRFGASRESLLLMLLYFRFRALPSFINAKAPRELLSWKKMMKRDVSTGLETHSFPQCFRNVQLGGRDGSSMIDKGASDIFLKRKMLHFGVFMEQA
jgi:hypothetical protein